MNADKKSEINVREAESRDAEAIAELLIQVGEVHSLGRPDIYKPHMIKHDADSVRELIQSRETKALVAEAGGEIIGELIYKIVAREEDAVYKKRSWLYIDDICVDVDSRGSGAAKALVSRAEEIAKKEGCASMELNCFAFNERAAAFYRSVGFTVQKSEYEKIFRAE